MWAQGEERVPATTLLAPPGSLSWVGAGLCWSQVKSAGTLESMIHHKVLTGTDTSCHLFSRDRTPNTSRWKWLQPLLCYQSPTPLESCSCAVLDLLGAGGNQHSLWPNFRPPGDPASSPKQGEGQTQEGKPVCCEAMPPPRLIGKALAKMF